MRLEIFTEVKMSLSSDISLTDYTLSQSRRLHLYIYRRQAQCFSENWRVSRVLLFVSDQSVSTRSVHLHVYSDAAWQTHRPPKSVVTSPHLFLAWCCNLRIHWKPAFHNATSDTTECSMLPCFLLPPGTFYIQPEFKMDI